MIDMVELEVPSEEVDRLLNDGRFKLEKEEYHKNGYPKKTIKVNDSYRLIYIHPLGSFNGKLFVKTSVHKLFNLQNFGEGHNYDRFTYNKLMESIKIIERDLNIRGDQLIVRNIEFGLNIKIQKEPRQFIESNIISFKDKTPNIQNNFEGSGFLSRYYLKEYELKIYDKSMQYNLDQHVLRVEMKTHRMSKVKMSGISFLSDLGNKAILKNLMDILLKHCQQLLIIDTLSFNDIPCNDSYFISKYIFPKSIIALSSKDKRKVKNKMNKLLRKYHYLNEKDFILAQIELLWEELLNDIDDINPPVVLPLRRISTIDSSFGQILTRVLV